MTQIKVGDKVSWATYPGEIFTVVNVHPDKHIADMINKLGVQYTSYYDELTVIPDTPELKPGMRVKRKDDGKELTVLKEAPAYPGNWEMKSEQGGTYIYTVDEVDIIPFSPTMPITPHQPDRDVKGETLCQKQDRKTQQELLDRFMCSLAASGQYLDMENICEKAKEILRIRNENLIK